MSNIKYLITYKIINESGIECEKVLKVSEGRPNITDLLANSDISMAINTSEAKESSKDDGKEIRRAVLRMNVPYFTTVAAAIAAVEAIKVLKTNDVSTPKSIQEFLND